MASKKTSKPAKKAAPKKTASKSSTPIKEYRDQVKQKNAARKTELQQKAQERINKRKGTPIPKNPFEKIKSQDEADELVGKFMRFQNDENMNVDTAIVAAEFDESKDKVTKMTVRYYDHNLNRWNDDTVEVDDTKFSKYTLL